MTSLLTPQQKADLLAKVVSLAEAQLGVQEVPRYSNAGPKVTAFLAAAGLDPGNPWCMAFAVWCYLQVLTGYGLHLSATKLIVTGLVEAQVDHARSLGTAISAAAAASGTAHVLAGYLMCEWEDSLARYAHTGIIETPPNAQGTFRTIEGNTNTDGGREGYEVARQTRCLHDTTASGHPKYAFIMTC